MASDPRVRRGRDGGRPRSCRIDSRTVTRIRAGFPASLTGSAFSICRHRCGVVLHAHRMVEDVSPDSRSTTPGFTCSLRGTSDTATAFPTTRAFRSRDRRRRSGRSSWRVPARFGWDPILSQNPRHALTIVTAMLTASLAEWLTRSRGAGFFTGLALALSPKMAWGSLSGMEVTLYAALVTATLVAYLRALETGSPWLGCCWPAWPASPGRKPSSCFRFWRSTGRRESCGACCPVRGARGSSSPAALRRADVDLRRAEHARQRTSAAADVLREDVRHGHCAVAHGGDAGTMRSSPPAGTRSSSFINC